MMEFATREMFRVFFQDVRDEDIPFPASKLVTKDELEITNDKIEGVQRGLDSNFERHSALEARVSKIEEELHL